MTAANVSPAQRFDFTDVSLFCGGGGESIAKELAKHRVGLVSSQSYALNHWPLAIEAQVKMIGNACPVNTVSALIENILRPRMDEYLGAT